MGREYGPDLTNIGRKYTHAQVLDQIIFPSKIIAPEFRTYFLTLRDDTELTGFMVRRTTGEIVLRGEDLIEHRLKASDVKEARESALSAMPEGASGATDEPQESCRRFAGIFGWKERVGIAEKIILMNTRAVIAFAFAGFLGLSTASAATNGTVLQSFPGGSGPGCKPCPDTTGAVGPNHVVDFEDGWFMVHDKATGKVVRQMTMSNFWMFVEPGNTLVLTTPNDPRMLYDPLSERWFASCADDATQHHLYLAVAPPRPIPRSRGRGARPRSIPVSDFRMERVEVGFMPAGGTSNTPPATHTS